MTSTETVTLTATVTPTATITPEPVPTCGAAPLTGCRVPAESGKGILLLRDWASDKRDRILWEWRKGAATALADFGDPVNTTHYAFCLYDETAGVPTLVLSATALAGGTCDGLPCWRAQGDLAFKYRDRATTSNGLRVLKLKVGAPGKAKIVVQFEGDNIAMPALPLNQGTAVTAQVVNSRGTCWASQYSAPARVNRSGKFRDLND